MHNLINKKCFKKSQKEHYREVILRPKSAHQVLWGKPWMPGMLSSVNGFVPVKLVRSLLCYQKGHRHEPPNHPDVSLTPWGDSVIVSHSIGSDWHKLLVGFTVCLGVEMFAHYFLRMEHQWEATQLDQVGCGIAALRRDSEL